MGIAIIGMLDEREPGLRLLRSQVIANGHVPILIDISVGNGAIDTGLTPDIDVGNIATAAGRKSISIQEQFSLEREKTMGWLADGLAAELSRLHQSGQLDGVIALVGMTGMLICLPAMKQLPFGKPKMLITSATTIPVYAEKLSTYFGIRDITVMHSVTDTVGMNPIVKQLIVNGAGAICGMVENTSSMTLSERPAIALTEFGFCDAGAQRVRNRLETEFEIVSFHATGVGEKAFMDFIRQGMFDAFIDLVPAGFSESLFGGNRSAGLDRFDPGIDSGKPYILAPCGFDMIGCGPIERKDRDDPLWLSRNLHNRKLFVQDAARVQARTSAEEMRQIANGAAERLNRCRNKRRVKIVIPLRGFSSLSTAEGPFYDPRADYVFIETLRRKLDPSIEIVDVDSHINAQAFADAVVDALERAMDDRSTI